ncbi:MAG TPA: hypothetical protein VFE88_03510 [Candidatus Nanoarchaeia archaeon]|nr:hypothetical protein [Candidatus Nanoarchaeia archaeon]
MAYIRIKDIFNNTGKTYTYAYLVQTTWRKRRPPKQKSLKYLGKLYTFPKIHNHPYCINHSLVLQDLYKDLLTLELLNHGFKKIKSNLYTNNNCYVDTQRFLFYNHQGKEIVLQLNSGFLCSHSIHTLLHHSLGNDRKAQKSLAKALALTGFSFTPEDFITLHEYLTHESLNQ